MRKKNTVNYELDPERVVPLTPIQQAELAALAQLPAADIDMSDIPLLPEEFWHTAIVNPFYRPVKQQLTVRLDADVLSWLRSAGRGYQTKLNAILRQAMVREAKIQARRLLPGEKNYETAISSASPTSSHSFSPQFAGTFS